MLRKIKNKVSRNKTPYQYCIDVIDDTLITGWAFKIKDASCRPNIEFKSNDILLWSTVAELYREDLEQAKFGDGKYAFSLVPSRSDLKESVTHVDLYIEGELIEAGIALDMKAIDISDYQVQVDHITPALVKGWVYQIDKPTHRAVVEVKCDDVVLATGLAEEYREDLLNAGFGDGYLGFSLIPNLHLFTSAHCECSLYIDGNVANIPPFILEVSQELIDTAIYQHDFLPEIENFTSDVDVQLEQLKQSIVVINQEASEDDYALSGQLQVAMTQIAELSVRVKIIEQVLLKNFSSK